MLCTESQILFIYLFIIIIIIWVCGGFSPFYEKKCKKEFSVTNSLLFFFGKISPKKWFFLISKIRHYCVQYDMKGCLRFYNSIFWILSNLAKYTYGLSPLEQQHKIEKTTLMHMQAHTERDGGLKKGNLANGLVDGA